MANYRPKKWRLGAMRHRVTIQRPIETQDEYGEPVVTWENWLVNEAASFHPATGAEVMRGEQVEANLKARFIVRYREDYDTQMRVLHNGKYYGIVFVNPVEGGFRYQELLVNASGDL